MLRFIFLITATPFLILQAALASAEAGKAVGAAESFVQLMQLSKNFSGSFEQRQFDEAGGVINEQTGKFYIASPGKIRWQTVEPLEQLLVSDGNTYWLYDPDLEQVTVSQITDEMQQTPALIFSGNTEALTNEYGIERVGKDFYRLSPIKENAIFESIEVRFNGSLITSMAMSDRLGQRTVFSFTEVVIDEKSDDSLFTFNAPDYVDIIYQ